MLLRLEEGGFDDRSPLAKEYREAWFRMEGFAYGNSCKSLIPVIGIYFAVRAISQCRESLNKSEKENKKDIILKFNAFRKLATLSLVGNIAGILCVLVGIYKIMFKG